MKKLLIHDYAGHPFQFDLSRELSKKYQVLHCFNGSNDTPKGKTKKIEGDLDTFNISPIVLSQKIDKTSFVKRWFQEFTYGIKLVKVIHNYKPDIILSTNTPLEAQFMLLIYSKIKNVKHIFWLQDMIAFSASVILKKRNKVLGKFIGGYFSFLEKIIARFSNNTIVTMESHIAIVENWKVKKERIALINNWAALDDTPVKDKENNWSKKYQYNDKFVFMWTGTMGLKHSPEHFINLSNHFSKIDNVKIVVVSESDGAKWLKQKKEELAIENLDILPYQDFKDVPDMMATADCLICLVSNDLADAAIPSKFLSYMCAKRSIILAIKDTNHAAKIAKKFNTALLCNPEDVDQLISHASKLYDNPELRLDIGSSAREYAENNFVISKISKKFEEVFQ